MKPLRIILLLMTLFASSLACNLGSRLAQETQVAIPVTTEAVGDLLDKVDDFENLPPGEIEITITEAEVTSLVALQLKERGDVPLSDIQVYLRDGKVKISGNYTENRIKLPIEAVAEPEVNAEGVFRAKLISAKVGPISAPEILRERAQEVIDDAVQEAMEEQAGRNFTVTGVTIADGAITIRGRKF